MSKAAAGPALGLHNWLTEQQLLPCRSRLPGLSGPLLQAPPLPVQGYSPQKTYIAIVASDGDNMQARAAGYLPAGLCSEGCRAAENVTRITTMKQDPLG